MYDVHNTVDRIKAAAKKAGIPVTELLSECGLSKNALSSMNSRGSWIASDSLGMIADYLGVSVDFLLGRDIKKSAPDQSVRSAVYDKISQLSDSQLDRLLGYLEALLSE